MKLNSLVLSGLAVCSRFSYQAEAYTAIVGLQSRRCSSMSRCSGQTHSMLTPYRFQNTARMMAHSKRGMGERREMDESARELHNSKFRDYHQSKKVKVQPERQYLRIRRLTQAIRQCNTTTPVDDSFQKPLTWLNREAYSNLRKAQGKSWNRRLQWVKEGALFVGKKTVAAIPLSITPSPGSISMKAPKALDIKVNGKECIDVTPKQAAHLLDILDQFLPTRKALGLRGKPNNKEQSTDLLSLVIKAGTKPEQIEQFMLQETGQLGWSLFKNMVLHPRRQSPLANPQLLDDSGRCLKMSRWRDRYIQAALKKVDITKLMEEVNNNNTLAGGDGIKALNIAVQHKLRMLLSEGVIGPQLIKIPKFSSCLNSQVHNTVALNRYQSELQLKPRPATQRIRPRLIKSFCMTDMPDAAKRASSSLKSGLIDVRPMSKKTFRHFCIDTFGYDRSSQVRGVAKGAQIFFKAAHWHGSLRANRLSFDEIGVALHEIVHAMDWLDDPRRFNSADPLIIYNKEKRPFHAQNQYLRVISDQNIFVEPRFSHSKEIGEFIKTHYKRANYTSMKKNEHPTIQKGKSD